MTFNALGTNLKGEEKTLAEKLEIVMPEAPKADKLTAKVLGTENLAEIVVELSNADLVDKAKLENRDNYRISGHVIKSAKLDGDNVVLLLDTTGDNEPLIKGRKYSLTIRNIDKKINDTYSFKAGDNAIPVVEDVKVLGEYGIKITTSEPINDPQEKNFQIDGKRVSMIAEQFGRDIILTPYHNETFPEDAKELKITELKDFAGYKTVTENFDIKMEKDEIAPKVVDSKMNANVLTVVFDKDVFHKSVKGYESRRDLGNVSYSDRRVNFYTKQSTATEPSAYKVAPNVVQYVFERDLPRNVEIEIDGVQNHSGLAMEKDVITPVLAVDDSAPVIISPSKMKSIGVDKVEGQDRYNGVGLTLTFDKDIDGRFTTGDNLDIVEHFELYESEVSRRGREAAKDVTYTAEKTARDKVKITFNNIKLNNRDKDFDYILEVKNFTDVTTLRNRMDREYVDFEVVPYGADFIIKDIDIFSANAGKDTEISIVFNKPVDKDVAEDTRNYFFEYVEHAPIYGDKASLADINGEAIVERDGKTVTLTIPQKIATVKKYKVLEILPRVTSLDGEQIANSRFFDLVREEQIPVNVDSGAEKVEKVTAINETVAPKAKVNAVAPVKASITGIQFAADVDSTNQFKLEIAVGNTVTTETFTVAKVSDTDKSADLEALVDAINNKSLGVKATVGTNKLNLEAEEAIENMTLAVNGTALLASSESDYVAPVATSGVAEVKAADKVNQVVEVVFEKLPGLLVKDMDVTFVGQSKVGKVTDVKGNVVEVTIEIDEADTNKALDYTTVITGIKFEKGITAINLIGEAIAANLKVTAK